MNIMWLCNVEETILILILKKLFSYILYIYYYKDNDLMYENIKYASYEFLKLCGYFV